MNKNGYEKPTMTVVELRHRTQLLAGSAQARRDSYGKANNDVYGSNSDVECGTITFDTYSFTPTWKQGTDGDHPNTWTYSPEEPANGPYGGLTLSISGNTWTLTPVTP